jgi:flavodoxin
MKQIVIYATKSGNTEKVANAIAAELGCPCIKISTDTSPSTVNLEPYDLVFMGTGIYKGQPSADLLSYLQSSSLKSSRRFALFVTCFGWGKEIADQNVVASLKSAVAAKGQHMLDNRFSCFGGGLGLVKRGHPDTGELADAKKWAKELVAN